MAADAQGNNIQAVGVPVTGRMGIAPEGTTIPGPAEGGTQTFTLDPAFKIPGLLKEDGGFEWTTEADGDAITFWQEGYSLPSGLANVELVVGFAQYDETVRSIVHGKTADTNGYITVDGGGHATRYVIFTEEIFKNGAIRRRIIPNAGVKSIQQDKSERGSVNGYQVTFGVSRSELVNNEHFGEWLLLPTDAEPVAPAMAPQVVADEGTDPVT